MIQKKIHYCWFGRSPKPELALKCINSWKKYCPNYEIIEWNEDNFSIENSPLYVRQAYDAKKWAFVSDYVRLKVVYEKGGIYLDTDVEVIRRLDDLMKYSAFFGFENSKNVATGLGFGSEPGNKIVKEMLCQYSEIPFIKEDGTMDETACPERNTEALIPFGLKRNGETQVLSRNVAIFAKDYFCPMDYGTGKLTITKNTYSIHHYQASWQTEEQKQLVQQYFKNLPRQLRRNKMLQILKSMVGEKRYRVIVRIKNKVLEFWMSKK